jgi:hypothetical protein
METETMVPRALTKEDVRAIRAATDAYVRVKKGLTTLELKKRTYGNRADKDGYTVNGYHSDPEYVIPLWTGSRSGFGGCSLYRDGLFVVFQKLVREGDELTFRLRENNNGYVNAAVIHCDRFKDAESRRYHPLTYESCHVDECVVTITRDGKQFVSDYLLDHAFGPDTTARMIQDSSELPKHEW